MASKSIANEIRDNLYPRVKSGFGRSKHKDKIQDRIEARAQGDSYDPTTSRVKYNIYTKAALNEVVRDGKIFWKYVNKLEGRRVPYEELPNYIEGYMQHLVDEYNNPEISERKKLSSRTISKKRTNLSKCFLVDLRHIEVPVREGEKKGRKGNDRYNPEAPENLEREKLYRSIGARRNEWRTLRPEEFEKGREAAKELGLEAGPDLHGRFSNLVPFRDADGTVIAVATLISKHGKTNVIEILEENREYVTDVFNSGEIYDFFGAPKYMETHASRRAYAQDLYQNYARPLEEIPYKERYICRNGSHKIYDKKALDVVAKSLGHNEGRYYDVVWSYLN